MNDDEATKSRISPRLKQLLKQNYFSTFERVAAIFIDDEQREHEITMQEKVKINHLQQSRCHDRNTRPNSEPSHFTRNGRVSRSGLSMVADDERDPFRIPIKAAGRCSL